VNEAHDVRRPAQEWEDERQAAAEEEEEEEEEWN
jgi:hypothetical protein